MTPTPDLPLVEEVPLDPLEFVRLALQGHLTILDLLDWLPIYKTGASWTPWRAFLASLYGLPMSQEEMAIYTACTGRKIPPTKKAREVWAPAGRRARKSSIAGLITVWESALRDHRHSLAPGERGVFIIMSESLERAAAVFNFAKTILVDTELKCLLMGTPNTERIQLWNNVDIVVRPAKHVAARSRTTIGCVFDEVAFFPTEDDYANPDEVIYQTLRPSMSTVVDPLVVAVSSPYARRGLLWKNYNDHHGREDSEILVWQASSTTMNSHPGVLAEMEQAYKDDPASADAEFGANFRTDIEAYISLDMIEAVTSNRGELPILKDLQGNLQFPDRKYLAFADPSGGGTDQFTLAIAHFDTATGKGVLDSLKAWKAPTPLSTIIEEVVDHLKSYNLDRLTGDHYAGDWPKDMFAVRKVHYQTAEYNRSELYIEFLPLVRAGLVDLPSNMPGPGGVNLAHKMKMQFTSLERITSGAGKDRVDHPKGKHDDLANSVAGVLVHIVPRARKALAARPAGDPQGPEDPSWPAKRVQSLLFGMERYTNPPPQVVNPYARRH